MGIFTFDNIFKILMRALVLFTAIPVHECAHAWAADKLGDPTARYQGRISLNPFVHLDLFGTICMLLTGFGWARPVGINPNNFRNRKLGTVLTSIAGPLSNVLLGFLAMIIYKFLSYLPASQSGILYYASYMFYYIILLNVGLAVFNLLPVPPLDGSKVLNAVLPDRIYFRIMQYEQYIFIALIFIMFSGILNPLLGFLRSMIIIGLDFLTGFVDIIMR
jgi:Zn-dependent protease